MTIDPDASNGLAMGDFTLDAGDERVWGPGGEVRLGQKAFRVLCELVAADGRLVTKDSLFSSVWDGTIVSESALTSAVKELRRALGDDPKQPRYIQSVYGRGYRLLEDVTRGEDARPAASATTARTPDPRETEREPERQPPLLCVPAFDGSRIAGTHPWLADVVREEVLLVLSRFRDVRLMTDTAAAAASAGDGVAAGYQLRVRLLPDGEAVTLYARIARLGAEEVIWADRFSLQPERAYADLEDFIRRIAAAALPRVEEDVLRHLPPTGSDVYGTYLGIRLDLRAAEGFGQTRAVAERLEGLIARRPDFVPAYAPLISLYNTDYRYTGLGSTTDRERERACELAHRALRIDPLEPHLHSVVAWCRLWRGEAGLARQALERALQLNPFHKDRLLEAATAFVFLDDLDRAADLLDQCARLSPFASDTPLEEVGLLHLLRGRDLEALASLRALARPTTSSELYALLAAASAGVPDIQRQVERWAHNVRRRWRGKGVPDAEALKSWVLYHHPFQAPERRAWAVSLLDPALRTIEAA